jgi:DNA-binding response OmpR family regulator
MDVLLVEDEPLVRELLEDDLVEAGLVVRPCGCAEEGLDCMAGSGQQPAVLVTDVNLGPGMDGLALAREVQRRWPRMAVVVITGDERNLAAMPAPLRETCLLKPFNPPRLVAAVNTLMGRSER